MAAYGTLACRSSLAPLLSFRLSPLDEVFLANLCQRVLHELHGVTACYTDYNKTSEHLVLLSLSKNRFALKALWLCVHPLFFACLFGVLLGALALSVVGLIISDCTAGRSQM